MYSTQSKIKVRYAETDQMGVVHHANYALYLELARIEWLDSLGISYKKMELDGVMLPVILLFVQYKNSAYFGDDITVECTLQKMPTATIEFDYKMYNQNSMLIATANTKLVFVDVNTKKPIRPPNYFLEKLKRLTTF